MYTKNLDNHINVRLSDDELFIVDDLASRMRWSRSRALRYILVTALKGGEDIGYVTPARNN